MLLYTILFSGVLLLSFGGIQGTNFTCDQCYYSVEHLNDAWNRVECLNSPATPGVSLVAKCSPDHYCFVQETYDLRTNQIYEFSRSCSANLFEDKCTKDTYHVICRRSCQGDFCNRNVIANLHEAFVNNLVG